MQAKRSAGILLAALSQLLVSPALQIMNLHSMGCSQFLSRFTAHWVVNEVQPLNNKTLVVQVSCLS